MEFKEEYYYNEKDNYDDDDSYEEKANIIDNDKIYIVLYYGIKENNDIKSFEILKGRVATYKYLKGISEFININESKVITDNVLLEESLSVYEFIKYIKNQYNVDDNFDVDKYN